MRVAVESPAADAWTGAGAPPLDDILAPFLPGAPAEVIELASHAAGRRGAGGG